MKIVKINRINLSENHYTVKVLFKTLFGYRTRDLIKEKGSYIWRFADNSEYFPRDTILNAFIESNKQEYVLNEQE